MKNIIRLFALLFVFQACSTSDSIIELDPNQSMCITGKGPGQDGAINPYSGSKSIAIVKNMDQNPFEVRIQHKGEVKDIIAVQSKEKKEIILEKDHELYFDSELATTTQVKFKRFRK